MRPAWLSEWVAGRREVELASHVAERFAEQEALRAALDGRDFAAARAVAAQRETAVRRRNRERPAQPDRPVEPGRPG